MSLKEQTAPNVWKQALIVPVPKVNRPKGLTHFQPVVLTSLSMKLFEKLVKSELAREPQQALHPMQFIYFNFFIEHIEELKML